MYKVYAIQYASREKTSSENFLLGLDPNHNAPMIISYYIWVAVSEKNIIVVDTGFSENGAKSRGRAYEHNPVEILESMGIKSDLVSHVIITHMHWDHIGNCQSFKNAKYILQEDEMSFWTGKHAFRSGYSRFVQTEEIVYLLEENSKGNIHFIDGIEKFLPGITVYKVGGHTPGSQIVKINTKKGDLVLASDASHFYQNINRDIPFPIVHNLSEMYDSFDLIKSLAHDNNLIIPGHDPHVMEKFDSVNANLDRKVVRLA